jgi:flavodoxin
MVGEFHCKGWDTYGPLKLVGGHNKGQPNEEDLKNAEIFAESVKKDHLN